MSTFDDPNREAVGLEPIWSAPPEPPPPEGDDDTEAGETKAKTVRKAK